MYQNGILSQSEAISHRINTTGITHKIGKNQVRAIRVLLTGTYEDMKRIEDSGQLDSWCKDNIQWLQETYGKNNVVSAALHIHIHATSVPIVIYKRRKAKKEEENEKRKYQKKKAGIVRLCADNVMARNKLKSYQDSYAQLMN